MARHEATLALTAIGAGGLLTSAIAFAATPETMLPARAEKIPKSYFGLHVHHPDQVWPSFPFGRLRLWDTGAMWFDLQPGPSTWNFDRLDSIVNHALRENTEVVLPLGMTPAWAASRPSEASPYGKPGAASEPADLQVWKNYVRTLAQRYKGKVHYYELWNEINQGTGFFTGSPDAMLELQKAAYTTLKEVDLSNQLISPSCVGESDAQIGWFESYLRKMNGQYADVIGYHFYIPRKSPEALVPYVSKIRALLQQTGNGKLPLWNTESGYRVNFGPQNASGVMSTWPNLDPALDAAYMVRSFVLGWTAGLDGFNWYAYDNGIMGMAAHSTSSSPVTEAYANTEQWLTNSTIGPCQRSGTTWSCRLYRGDQKYWIAWNEDNGTHPWPDLDSTHACMVGLMDGSKGKTEAGKPIIGPMPAVLRDNGEISCPAG